MPNYPTGPYSTTTLHKVGKATGTRVVRVAAHPVGTVYPLRLPGQVPGVVAWVAHRQGAYVGHERSCAAAVRAVLAA